MVLVVVATVGGVVGFGLLDGDNGSNDSDARGSDATSAGTDSEQGVDGDGGTDGSRSPGNDPDGTGDGDGAAGNPRPGDPESVDIVTTADLTPFLLRGADLPAGWRAIIIQPSDPDPDSCLADIDLNLQDGRRSNRVSYQQGSSGPTLTNAITDFPRTETAEEAIDILRRAFDACDGRAVPAGAASIGPAPIGATTADEAVAAVIAVDGQPVARFLYARVGSRITYVLAVGTEVAAEGIADEALETVVTRLRAG